MRVAQRDGGNLHDGITRRLPFKQRIVQLCVERCNQYERARLGPHTVQLLQDQTHGQTVGRLDRKHRQARAERAPLAIDQRRIAHRK